MSSKLIISKPSKGLPWKYINEGNLHIVLEVLGTDYVLRLIKENGNPVDLESIQTAIDFVNFVIQPLLFKSDSRQELVEIPFEELQKLSDDLVEIRPEIRRCKSVLSRYAIKASNLTILSPECKENYCIEIKPKEGFQASRLKSTGKCYYCLKQSLKLMENLIDTKSQYCPVDLFSGQRSRMKMALSCLVENPQNNFRIYKDGNMVFHEKSNKRDLQVMLNGIPAFQHSINTFFEFIIEVLLSKTNTNKVLKLDEHFKSFKRDYKQCSLSPTLETDTFIYKLYALQYLAEEINFDYNKVCMDYDSIHVRKMIDLARSTPKNLLLDKLGQTQRALISATARDCSIMITFTPKCEANFPNIEIGDHRVSYKVSVTDLEPKGLKTLIKRAKTEKKLLEIFNSGRE